MPDATPDPHPTEIAATHEEIVLMNEAGRAFMDAFYTLMERDKLGGMSAFVSIMQMALSRSKLDAPEALACIQEVVRHNFGPSYGVGRVPPEEGDKPAPDEAIH